MLNICVFIMSLISSQNLKNNFPSNKTTEVKDTECDLLYVPGLVKYNGNWNFRPTGVKK